MQKILQQSCLLKNDQPIIIGVSGGADSLTLLDIVASLNYPVVVAHYNHMLRSEARDDAKAVEGIAAKMGVPFVCEEGATHIYSQEHGLSIEEAARELRYSFLFEQAKRYEAQAVAVGHNADDQVETVLMHLLRGAGLDGLTGMDFRFLPNPWSETIPLIRPLLSIPRTEIVAYCAEKEFSPIVDLTNTDTSYFRNRLRQELIPELDTYIPGIRNRIWQTADLLTADRHVLDETTNSVWENLVVRIDSDFIQIHQNTYNQLSLGIQRRIIRKAISHLRLGGRNIDFSMVQRALNFSSKPTNTGQADLGLGLRIAIDGDTLIISDWCADLPIDIWPQVTDQIDLIIPGELDLGIGWFLKAEFPSDGETAKIDAWNNDDPNIAWIDIGGLEPLLKIRQRNIGDRFQPLGMEGNSVKLSDFMANQKIPRRARAAWPLICIGEQIAWIPGFRLGYPFRVTSRSQNIVKLMLLVK